MKRWAALMCVIAAAVAALVVSQRRKVEAPVGPQGVLGAIAETERDATRLPAHITRISDEEEIRAGDQIAGRMRQKAAPDAAIEAYLQKVAARMAPYTARKLPYRVHYIDDPWFVNAFAIPGGHVFIGAGLMSLMDSEDELASVLGHEMEHIDHYHCAERLQTEATLRKIPIAGVLASIPVAIFQMGYTKDQELEADRDGTYLAYRAGYSPTGALRMFEAFDRLERRSKARKPGSPADEAGHVVTELVSGYFRSHPFGAEREEAIRRLITDEKWPPRPERDILLDCSAARKRQLARNTPGQRTTAGADVKPEPPCRMRSPASNSASGK